jgi:hypothetical protein
MNTKNFDWEKVYMAIFLIVLALIPFRVSGLIDFRNFCLESKRCEPLHLNFLVYSCLAAGVLYVTILFLNRKIIENIEQ